MKNSFGFGPALYWVIGVLLFVAATSVFGTDRIWDGDLNSFWATANNWSNNVAPVAGDNLFFPAGMLLPSITTNNFAAGTAFGRITIAQVSLQGYVLGGNRVVLNDGIFYTGNQLSTPPFIACDITLGVDQIFSATRGITLAGRVDLSGRTLTISSASTGNIFFSGNVTNSTGSSQLNKTNTGLMVVAPSARVAAVPISVLRGTLRVDGAVTNGSGNNRIEVNAVSDIFNPLPRGSAVLTGSGAVDIAEVHDTITPGNNGPGILHCNYLDLTGYSCGLFCGAPSGEFLAELNGTVAGTNYDQLEVYAYDLFKPQDGSIIYNFGLLDVRVGYNAQPGDTFQIIRLLPGNPFNRTYYGGIFSGVPPLSILDTTNGYSLGINYTNGVALTTLRAPDSPFQLWKGSGIPGTTNYADPTWSSTNNWGGNVSPQNTGHLRFTEYQYRSFVAGAFGGIPFLFTTPPPPQTNDIVGLTLASLTFFDTNYVIYGNGVTVTEGVTNHASGGTNICNLDLAVINSLVFDVDGGAQLVLSGAFGGGGTVFKNGDGELRYNGTTANAFVGNVVLNNGTLRVNGALTDPDLTVNDGVLCGTGTVSSVTMNGGRISPGDSPGILHVQGNLNLAAGATCQLELNGPSAGSGYDQLQINGTVTLNGAMLNLLPGYSATVGSVFLVIANDGSDPVVGTFAGLPQGAVFQAGGQYFSISYQSGSGGNDVVLTRVNPPPPPGVFSGIAFVDPATVQLQGSGGSNINYTVQANTNLASSNWLNIGTATANGSGVFSFNDTNTVVPQRFYRLRWP